MNQKKEEEELRSCLKKCMEIPCTACGTSEISKYRWGFI